MNAFFNRKIISILFLGFSSGLPLGLISSTLQAWYTVSGVSLMTIGWLTLVGQPYALKFLWAPLLDRFSPMHSDRRRSWIFLMQFGLAVSLIFMAFLNPAKMPFFLAFLALIVSLFSATQDTAIDAYRTELLSDNEKGLGVAVNNVAYRAAMLASTAVALMVADQLGWRAMYLIMAGLFFGLLIMTKQAPSIVNSAIAPTSLKEAMLAPGREFFARKNAVMLLLFMVLYKLCDAMALSLNTTFLIRGVGFHLIDIAMISKTVGLIASILGGLMAGWLMSRLTLYRALFYFGLLQALSNLLYVWLACVGHHIGVMGIAIGGEYFFSGMASVAFVVFLMDLCDRRYTATQYALFSAVATIGRIFIGPVSAWIVNHVGWVEFYIWSTVIGFPALAILWLLNARSSIFVNRIQNIRAVAE